MNCLNLGVFLRGLWSWTLCFRLDFFQSRWLLLIVNHSDGSMIVAALCVIEGARVSPGCAACWTLPLSEWVQKVFDYHCCLLSGSLLESKFLHLYRLVNHRFFVILCRCRRIILLLVTFLHGGRSLSRWWQVALNTFLTSTEIWLVGFWILIRLSFGARGSHRWLWLPTSNTFERFLCGSYICRHRAFQPAKTWIHLTALVVRASIWLLLLRHLDVLGRI